MGIRNTTWQPHPLPPHDPKEQVKTTYIKGNITKLCEKAFQQANASFGVITSNPEMQKTMDLTRRYNLENPKNPGIS